MLQNHSDKEGTLVSKESLTSREVVSHLVITRAIYFFFHCLEAFSLFKDLAFVEQDNKLIIDKEERMKRYLHLGVPIPNFCHF